MQRTHEALTSSLFWAVNSMVCEVSYQAEYIGRFCEGCSCLNCLA